MTTIIVFTMDSNIILPAGWLTATDPVSGSIYYANPSTGQTSWEPPVSFVPKSPHPPKPSTINAPGLLIPAVRSIVSKNAVTESSAPNDVVNRGNNGAPSLTVPVELTMRAGMIADLVDVQSIFLREQGEVEIHYEPLKPFDLPITLSVDPIPESRIDARLLKLAQALEKI